MSVEIYERLSEVKVSKIKLRKCLNWFELNRFSSRDSPSSCCCSQVASYSDQIKVSDSGGIKIRATTASFVVFIPNFLLKLPLRLVSVNSSVDQERRKMKKNERKLKETGKWKVWWIKVSTDQKWKMRQHLSFSTSDGLIWQRLIWKLFHLHSGKLWHS